MVLGDGEGSRLEPGVSGPAMAIVHSFDCLERLHVAPEAVIDVAAAQLLLYLHLGGAQKTPWPQLPAEDGHAVQTEGAGADVDETQSPFEDSRLDRVLEYVGERVYTEPRAEEQRAVDARIDVARGLG